jgi:poly(hydroxyalkanoate) depolymerase family esterase
MRSPAAAIAWELRRRHRWGFAAAALSVALLAAIGILGLGPEQGVTGDDDLRLAIAVIVPLSFTFMYFLALFSFGFSGDLTARASIYPARMFTLPVTNAALVGWPMLYGTVAIAALWLPARLLGAWPPGFDVPLIWPALLGAVFLAWTQALMWMPYGLPWLRVILTVLWLTSLDVVVFVALDLKVSEPVMLVLLAPHVPLAFLVGRFAVSRARRGETPDWRQAIARPGWARDLLSQRRGHFSSPQRAQVWFEWRRHGRSLPVLVAILLPFELALLFLFSGMPELVLETLVAILLTPPFMAAFVAATVSRSSPDGSDSYELTPFMATRPLSSASLIAAKLEATIRSTLATWLLVFVAVPLTLWLSGASSVVIDAALRVVEIAGTPRAVAIGLLGLAALVAATWKQLVRSLYIGMSGRAWLVKGSVFATLSFLTLVVVLAQWVIGNVDAVVALWRALPWILAVLVCFKIAAAARSAARLHRSRLVGDRALVTGTAAWLVAVLALYGLLAWLLAFPPSMPRLLPGLVAILAIPLARLSAAPLALAWNRHRGGFGEQDPGTESASRRTRSRPPQPDLDRRRVVIGATLLMIFLPAVLVLVEAVSFHLRSRSNGSIVSSGEEREYLLHVPASYDSTTPTPLVISMHGGASWPAQQMALTRWSDLADENRFIVVYPAGTGYPKRWRTFEEGPGLERDVRFVSDLIDELQSTYNIDRARIYVNGLSNGGGMAFVLSCTLSERIAAVGMVAPAQSLPPGWCRSTRPVPMIDFHGAADPIVFYGGGSMGGAFTPVRPVFPVVRDWVADWAIRNRCAPVPVESEVAGDVSRLEYIDCADDAAVVLVTIHGGGHTWPGGEPLPAWFAGPTTGSIDATRQMWAFFNEHQLVRN